MFCIFTQSQSLKMSECDKIIARYPENVFLCYPKCCINRGFIVTDVVIFATDSRIRDRVVLFGGASIIAVSPYMSGIV